MAERLVRTLRNSPWLPMGAVVGIGLAWFGLARGGAKDPEPTPEAAPPAPAPSAVVAAASAAPVPEMPGKALYDRYCKLCHGAQATGYAADNAPSLVSRTFLESATDEFIARGIEVGRPNTPMAAYGQSRGGPLSLEQISEIVRWLRSKGPAPIPLPAETTTGDPKRGAVVYEQRCQSCHGTDKQRGVAPMLYNKEFLASASAPFLRYAIVHGRPPTTMLPFAGRLSPQQIDDVVAWMSALGRETPPAAPSAAPVVPDDLPLVINPKGARPTFTMREGRFVSAEQVKNALAAKNRIVVVDARAPSDWLQFRIPGSVPIPYYDRAKLERIPNDGTWVIAYCACPHHASGEVVDALRAKGYKNTAVLDEGILFWRERGYPLEGQAVSKPANPPAKRP